MLRRVYLSQETFHSDLGDGYACERVQKHTCGKNHEQLLFLDTDVFEDLC